jgi:O-methyltransferase domain/Dimerisation domain
VKAVIGRRARADVRQRLVERITACWRTQALHAAVQLELPDLLSKGPAEVACLAQACDCEPEPLQRLLRALCTLEVCRERRDGRFALAAAGALLCRDPPREAPGLRSMALWWGGPMWPVWNDILRSVRTGTSARTLQTGRPHYGFLDDRPDLAEVFHDTMRALTAQAAEDVAMLPTWRGAHEVVDVGGGHGELAAAIAAAHPSMRAAVLDRADAEAGARALFARRQLAHRTRFIVGDFFADIPCGADRYVLKSILHNWDDVACRRIIACCARAAPARARLVIVERLRPRRLGSNRYDEAVARTDLNMLLGLGGRERTLTEFAALLEPAGFSIVETTRTRCEFSAIEAVRS